MVTPFYKDKRTVVYVSDCRELMRWLPPDSIDAIVTDPPYEIGFMAKGWDAAGVAFEVETWRLALRVAKPGAFLVAFGAPRSYHRLAVAIEDAGWEIRDSLMWMFGSGFPKSHDVSKAIDRKLGANRAKDEYTGANHLNAVFGEGMGGGQTLSRAPAATPEAEEWFGWGTALKPAYEPVVLARKPLRGTTIAENVLQYGTGGLNIDGTRIGVSGGGTVCSNRGEDGRCLGHKNAGQSTSGETFHAAIPPKDLQPRPDDGIGFHMTSGRPPHELGRWPANVILDEEAAAILDEEVGDRGGGFGVRWQASPGIYGGGAGYQLAEIGQRFGFGDRGGPSRFFYTAKASRSEREAGLEGFEAVRRSDGRKVDISNPRLRTNDRRNHHPTVKPVSLMAWLVRLVSAPDAVVLDPFLGSGSTRLACQMEGRRFIGCDLDEDYVRIGLSRTAESVAPLVDTSEPTVWGSMMEIPEDAKYVNLRPTI